MFSLVHRRLSLELCMHLFFKQIKVDPSHIQRFLSPEPHCLTWCISGRELVSVALVLGTCKERGIPSIASSQQSPHSLFDTIEMFLQEESFTRDWPMVQVRRKQKWL